MLKATARCRTHCAQGGIAKWAMPNGGWRRTQFGQSLPRTRCGGVVPGKLLSVGEGDSDELSAATGQAVSYGAGGNRVAGVSVRSVVSYDRSMLKLRRRRWSSTATRRSDGAGGADCPFQPRREKPAKRVMRSAGESRWVGESGMPSCFCKPPP